MSYLDGGSFEEYKSKFELYINYLLSIHNKHLSEENESSTDDKCSYKCPDICPDALPHLLIEKLNNIQNYLNEMESKLNNNIDLWKDKITDIQISPLNNEDKNKLIGYILNGIEEYYKNFDISESFDLLKQAGDEDFNYNHSSGELGDGTDTSNDDGIIYSYNPASDHQDEICQYKDFIYNAELKLKERYDIVIKKEDLTNIILENCNQYQKDYMKIMVTINNNDIINDSLKSNYRTLLKSQIGLDEEIDIIFNQPSKIEMMNAIKTQIYKKYNFTEDISSFILEE